jgi:S-adenosylmethionine synthetase
MRGRYIYNILSASHWQKGFFMSNTTNNITLFTSESVCAGHPDKICDAISDAIVDAALAGDTNSRCGVETVAGANQICLFGEIRTKTEIDYEKVARETVEKLGYTVPAWGFSQESSFSNDIHEQSAEIGCLVMPVMKPQN